MSDDHSDVGAGEERETNPWTCPGRSFGNLRGHRLGCDRDRSGGTTRTATSEHGGASWSSHGSYGECGWFRSGSGGMGAPAPIFKCFNSSDKTPGLRHPTRVDVERNRDLRGTGGQQPEDGTTVDSNFYGAGRDKSVDPDRRVQPHAAWADRICLGLPMLL